MFFNSMPLMEENTPLEVGLKEWSVVDVVVEKVLFFDDDESDFDGTDEDDNGDEQWSDYSAVTRNQPDFTFTTDTLQHVMYLKLLMGGRFIDT